MELKTIYMVKEFLLDMSAISNDWLEQLRPEFSKAYYKTYLKN